MNGNNVSNRSDKTVKLLTTVVVLQVLTLAGTWLGQGSGAAPALLPAAQAQAVDPGSQRREMITELQTLNAKMDKLISVLEGGNLQVKAITDDEKSEKAPAKSGR
jgi:outer membrane murein-binding lipoprotein Lpp